MSDERLARRVGTVGATAIVVSNMIGTGIFTTTGFLAGDLGSPALVIGIWLVGGLLALAGAVSYVELAFNFPRSGGEYVYLSEAWGPEWGFIVGMVSFFAGFSAPVAAAALAISAYLGLAGEGAGLALGPLTFRLADAQLFACAVVAAFTLLNVLGSLLVSRLQTVLTTIKLAVICGFLALGFGLGAGDTGNLGLAAERTSDLSVFEQFASSLVFVFFGYSGWNGAVYIAEEVEDPKRAFPVALAAGTALVTALYLALNVLYVYGVPIEELQGVVAVGSHVAARLFGEGVSTLFSLAMAVSLLATVNAMCMVGPRVYYAMARDGAFFSVAASVHPTWKSPWVAVLMQGACSLLLIVTPTFRSLVFYIGFTLYLFTALSVLAIFKFRRRDGWIHFRWLDRTYPWLPLIYVGMSFWVLVFSIRSEPVASVLSLLTVVLGAAAYRLRRTPAERNGSTPSRDSPSSGPTDNG